MSHRSIQLAAAIVNRGVGNRAASMFPIYDHGILLAVKGHGIVSSTVVDCLELDGPEKGLVLDSSNKPDADRLLHALGREMEFYKSGHGIAFTLSLSGISLATTGILDRHGDQTVPNSHTAEHKEDTSVISSHPYELIASVTRTDLSVPVMETVREANCQGSTLIKAREIGIDVGKKPFGMILSQEKAMPLISIPAGLRFPILKAIRETVTKETGEYAVAISLLMGVVERLAD